MTITFPELHGVPFNALPLLVLHNLWLDLSAHHNVSQRSP